MENILANPLLLGFIALAVATIVLIGVVIYLSMKLNRFLVGIDSDHVGDSLEYLRTNVDGLQEFRDELKTYLGGVERRLKKSVQSVHTVRFNPFKGTGGGGNQSFATAFLNEEGDGVIVSSLYSREYVSVFGKPVKNYASEHELSEEEAEALDRAKEKIK